jgi:hypothetical protein
MRHTLHLRPGVAKQPNLELKTRPKQLLGSLPLVIALPVSSSICVALPKVARASTIQPVACIEIIIYTRREQTCTARALHAQIIIYGFSIS